MEQIAIYLLALTSVSIWVMMFNMKFDGDTFYYKHKWIKYLDFKPLNCKLCLSFWVGILMAICLGDILYISLPLIHLIKD
jgi:hypothetical protein